LEQSTAGGTTASAAEVSVTQRELLELEVLKQKEEHQRALELASKASDTTDNEPYMPSLAGTAAAGTVPTGAPAADNVIDNDDNLTDLHAESAVEAMQMMMQTLAGSPHSKTAELGTYDLI
jgi:hypothetical protein